LRLGTGNGYIAFALAERFPNASFMGLDIAEKSIATNNQIVKEDKKNNVLFKSYEGKRYPFESSSFDGIISRYALHHFPNIKLSLAEINRVLKDDGHKHFFYENELTDLFQQYSFSQKDIFYSYVRYPRPYDSRYEKLLENHQKEITSKYHVKIEGSNIYI
jgi:ubiquinone/menaquinone biosynthesis C-methylase UbiE